MLLSGVQGYVTVGCTGVRYCRVYRGMLLWGVQGYVTVRCTGSTLLSGVQESRYSYPFGTLATEVLTTRGNRHKEFNYINLIHLYALVTLY